MRRLLFISLLLALCHASAQDLPLVGTVEPQPFLAALRQLIDTADQIGAPFTAPEKAALEQATRAHDSAAVAAAQRTLDASVLFLVQITPEMRVKVSPGPARAVLDQAGWRPFLVKVINEAGCTAKLRVLSEQAKPVFDGIGRDSRSRQAQPIPEPPAPRESRWLDLKLFEAPPMNPALSGLAVEYRFLQLYSRDSGKRQATIAFDVGQGTQDLGFRNEAAVLFECRPARDITLRVLDENGTPCTASFLIRDRAGRVHPSQIKRVAPDFGFHPQIYRADGEALKLPDGDYDFTFQRGPESLAESRPVRVDASVRELRFQVRRWIDPSKLGWWSGDHHIHAAGCAHYTIPSEGVQATDMARHCQGEDLKIGANLTWGPCFDYQKQFFSGADNPVSRYPFLLHYDVEVSGFGSHKSGHLCLLKLKEQIYPGGDSKDHWPTLCLNTLRWAKKQGALCGPAHSGWGLQPASGGEDLPNQVIPPFNGIGANEYIVDVTHEVEGPEGQPVPAVDFLSLADTPHTWELNIWYHTLNAGFRTRASGETDFPCIYGERVGLGRSYARLDGRLDYDAWCEAIRAGRCYVSDGKSHLLDFQVNGVRLGEGGSELRLTQPATVRLRAKVAARLPQTPLPEIQALAADKKPYWDIERARIGTSREVPVEVIFNGEPVTRQNVVADGELRDISFDLPIAQSGWVALRIRASSHTNPVFVLVGDRPIRVRRSLEWCLKSVDQCWKEKEKHIAAPEHGEAVAAYDHARRIYRERLQETAAP
jgi:hypothetical protein